MASKYSFRFGMSGRDDDRGRPLRRAGRRARESTSVGRYNLALAKRTRSRSALQAAALKATEAVAQREADRDLTREVAEKRLQGAMSRQRPEYHGTTLPERDKDRDLKAYGMVENSLMKWQRARAKAVFDAGGEGKIDTKDYDDRIFSLKKRLADLEQNIFPQPEAPVDTGTGQPPPVADGQAGAQHPSIPGYGPPINPELPIYNPSADYDKKIHIEDNRSQWPTPPATDQPQPTPQPTEAPPPQTEPRTRRYEDIPSGEIYRAPDGTLRRKK